MYGSDTCIDVTGDCANAEIDETEKNMIIKIMITVFILFTCFLNF